MVGDPDDESDEAGTGGDGEEEEEEEVSAFFFISFTRFLTYSLPFSLAHSFAVSQNGLLLYFWRENFVFMRIKRASNRVV